MVHFIQHVNDAFPTSAHLGKCLIFLHLLHDSFLAGHFSRGLCALYPYLSHFWACSLLPFGFMKLSWLQFKGLHLTPPCGLKRSTDADGCFECKVFAFFQATLSYSFIQRVTCYGVPNKLICLGHVLPSGYEFVVIDEGIKRFPLQLASSIEFFLASRCALNFSATRSSMSLSRMSCLFSPDPTWTVFHWKVT